MTQLTEHERALIHRLIDRELDYSQAYLESTFDEEGALEDELEWQRELKAIRSKI